MKKILYVVLAIVFMLPVFVKADSLVDKINVEGIGDLDLTKKTWNLNLSSTLDYTVITVEAGDGITVEGGGKLDIVEGNNSFVITATDGKITEEYTININVTRPSENNTENPETGAFIPTSIIILAGVSLIGVILLNNKKKFYSI